VSYFYSSCAEEKFGIICLSSNAMFFDLSGYFPAKLLASGGIKQKQEKRRGIYEQQL